MERREREKRGTRERKRRRRGESSSESDMGRRQSDMERAEREMRWSRERERKGRRESSRERRVARESSSESERERRGTRESSRKRRVARESSSERERKRRWRRESSRERRVARESSSERERRGTTESSREMRVARESSRRMTRDRENSRDKRVTRERLEKNGPIHRKLYVKNLSAKMTMLNLRKLFRPYGIIELIELPCHHKTGESKGFGFVQFAQRRDAEMAKSFFDEHGDVGDNKIEVFFVADQLNEAALAAQSKALLNEEDDMTYVAAKCLSLARESDSVRPCVLDRHCVQDSLINGNSGFDHLNMVSSPTECLKFSTSIKFETEELRRIFSENVEKLAKKYGVLKNLYVDQNTGTVYMRFESVQEALAMQRVMHLRCYCEYLVYAVFNTPQVHEAMEKTFPVRDARDGDKDDAEIPATVVLRHMFSQDEMMNDEFLCGEVKEDVISQSSKHGPLLSVKVCKHNPQGLVLVSFKDRNDAQMCIDAMNGRWYAKRQIHASFDDGSVNQDAEFDLEAEG